MFVCQIWQVMVQTRQRLDIHGSVGAVSCADLVIRGDKYPRRVCAYATPAPNDVVAFKPDTIFQLVPGAYNRVALNVHPKTVGFRCVVFSVQCVVHGIDAVNVIILMHTRLSFLCMH